MYYKLQNHLNLKQFFSDLIHQPHKLTIGQELSVLFLVLSVLLIPLSVQLALKPLNLRNFAQVPTTPSTPPEEVTPTPVTAVNFSTPYVSLTADEFYVLVDGKKFTSTNYYSLHSETPWYSQVDKKYHTTVEVEWIEHDVEMRLFIYFEHNNKKWWATDVWTYSGKDASEWVYYKGFNGKKIGEALQKTSLKVRSNKNDSRNTVKGEVYFKNLRLQPFVNNITPTPTPTITHNYTLEQVPNESFPLYLSDYANGGGYAIYAILKDNDNVVVDQSDFRYFWRVSDTTLASITPFTGCTNGIQEPCPYDHAAVRPLRAGDNGYIYLEVQRISTGQVILPFVTFPFRVYN